MELRRLAACRTAAHVGRDALTAVKQKWWRMDAIGWVGDCVTCWWHYHHIPRHHHIITISHVIITISPYLTSSSQYHHISRHHHILHHHHIQPPTPPHFTFHPIQPNLIPTTPRHMTPVHKPPHPPKLLKPSLTSYCWSFLRLLDGQETLSITFDPSHLQTARQLTNSMIGWIMTTNIY